MKLSFNYKEQNNSAIASIGLMRGIASVMVCFFHFSVGNPRMLPESSIVKIIGKFGWSGVEIFFVISGFVIPYSMFVKNYSFDNTITFLKKRIIRIEPPYLFSIVLVLFLNYLVTLVPFYRGAPFHIDWQDVAGHIAYLNVFTGAKWLQDVYWTLAVEFQYYLLIAVVYKLIVSKSIYNRILFPCLFFALYFLKPLSEHSIFQFVSFFMMGILLFQRFCGISTAFEFWFLLLITTIASFFFQGYMLTGLSLVTLFMIAFIKKVHPFLAFFGTVSYSLYLTHAPFGGRIINLSEAFIQSVHIKELVVFIALVFSFFVAYVYYILIEKRFKEMAGKINYTEKRDTLERELN